MQDQQAGIHYTLASHWGIHNHINRFIEAGISIEIFTHTHTDTFSKFVHSLIREVFGTVECHMFQEMCQPALIFFFENGTDVLGDIEIGPFFW